MTATKQEIIKHIVTAQSRLKASRKSLDTIVRRELSRPGLKELIELERDTLDSAIADLAIAAKALADMK